MTAPARTDDLLSDIAVDQLKELRRLRDANRALRRALAEAYASLEKHGFAGAARLMREKVP